MENTFVKSQNISEPLFTTFQIKLGQLLGWVNWPILFEKSHFEISPEVKSNMHSDKLLKISDLDMITSLSSAHSFRVD